MTFSSVYGTSPYGYDAYGTITALSVVTLGAIVSIVTFTALNENRNAAASDPRSGISGKDGRAYTAQDLRAAKAVADARRGLIAADTDAFTATDNRKTNT